MSKKKEPIIKPEEFDELFKRLDEHDEQERQEALTRQALIDDGMAELLEEPELIDINDSATNIIEQLKDQQYAASNETALDMVVKGFAKGDQQSLARNKSLIQNIMHEPVNDHVFLALKEKLKPELKQPHVKDFMRRHSWKKAFDEAKRRHSKEQPQTTEPISSSPTSTRG